MKTLPKQKASAKKSSIKKDVSKDESVKVTTQEEPKHDRLDKFDSARQIAEKIIKAIGKDFSTITFRLLESDLQTAALDDDHSHYVFDQIENYLQKVNDSNYDRIGRLTFNKEFNYLSEVAEKYYTEKWRTKVNTFDMPKQLETIKKLLLKNSSMKYLCAGLKVVESELEQSIDDAQSKITDEQKEAVNKNLTEIENEEIRQRKIKAKNLEVANGCQTYFVLRVLQVELINTEIKKAAINSFITGFPPSLFQQERSRSQNEKTRNKTINRDLDIAIQHLRKFGMTKRMEEEITIIKNQIGYRK